MFVRIIFLEPTKSRGILVLMPHVPCPLRALMSHVPLRQLALPPQVARALRVLHNTRFRVSSTSSLRVSRAFLVSCPTCHRASCALRCMYPHPLRSFTCLMQYVLFCHMYLVS